VEYLIGFGLVAMIIQLLLRRKSDIETIRPDIPRPGAHNPPNLPNMDQLRGVFETIKDISEQAQREAAGAGARIPTREEKRALVDMIRRGSLLEAAEFYAHTYRVDADAARRAIEKLRMGGNRP
jgi:hypothetical protein